jgi:hypothetical protein
VGRRADEVVQNTLGNAAQMQAQKGQRSRDAWGKVVKNRTTYLMMHNAPLDKLKSLQLHSIELFEEQIKTRTSNGEHINWSVYIDMKLYDEIRQAFSALQDNKGRYWITDEDEDAWQKWPTELFFRRLKWAFPNKGETNSQSLISRVTKIHLHFTDENMWEMMNKYLLKVRTVCKEFTDLTEARTFDTQKAVIKHIMDRIRQIGGAPAEALLNKLRAVPPQTKIWDFMRDFTVIDNTRKDVVVLGQSFGMTVVTKKNENKHDKGKGHDINKKNDDKGGKGKTHFDKGNKGVKPTAEPGTSKVQDPEAKPICPHCGRNDHKGHGCAYLKAKHPDTNPDANTQWADSAAGKAAAQKNIRYLRFGRKVDGSKFDMKTKSEYDENVEFFTALLDNKVNVVSKNTLQCELIINNNALIVNVLIDTGCLQSNYVDRKTAAWIQEQKGAQGTKPLADKEYMHVVVENYTPNNISDTVVGAKCCDGNFVLSNGVTNQCATCVQTNVVVNDKLSSNVNDLRNTSENLNSLLNNNKKSGSGKRKIDHTVKTNHTTNHKAGSSKKNTTKLTPSQTTKRTKVCSGINGLCTYTEGEVTFDIKIFNEILQGNEVLKGFSAKVLDTPYNVIIGRNDIGRWNLFDRLRSHFSTALNDEVLSALRAYFAAHSSKQGNSQLSAEHIMNALYKKDELINIEYDDDGVSSDDDEELPWERDDTSKTSVHNHNNITEECLIEGPLELQNKIRALIKEYSDIFSNEVKASAADLPPMELEVDKRQWECNKNHLAPRLQTSVKQAEIRRQVKKMLDLKVIKESQAVYYSQTHLQPKPNGKWRFCIDYRRLNDVCKAMGWPIPNVAQLLRRLGEKRASYFGVMDLTSGYHQAPLSKNSQEASAFITPMGVFEWLRVPMGLKGAPSYFQQKMAMTVLRGLVYSICEVYLDDIIVPGSDEQEFITNLRSVFERFRKHKMTLNPAKCKFGVSQVEYVGHMINKDGMTFSEDKLREVLDFPKPITHHGMKSFLGLANYFRDHIRNHSTLVQPLQEMVSDYNKHRPLKWTADLEARFDEVRETIGKCPTLFFVDEKLPIYLHTDASDYGVGAYLFQKDKEGKELPIAFVSQSLSRERFRWSVPEKEAYAIYYAFQKLEYLIRDAYFILRTDHKNLTYINMEGSPKVKRWKMAIQEYNFDVEHIAGKDNIVADAMSRLCSSTSELDEAGEAEFISLLESVEPLRNDAYRKIAKVHNSLAGHHGIDRTVEKLRRIYPDDAEWPDMLKNVKQFIKQCPVCQKLSEKQPKIFTTPFTTAAMDSMSTLNVDSIGPNPPDKDGNTYILVIIDCFTRYVELYALKDLTAETACHCLLQHIGRYGAPTKLRSDNGSQFVNEIIAELLRIVGTEHELTLAYSKEENAIVERANKEVMRHLRAICLDRSRIDDWGRCLPLVQRIMNASEHSATGFSPAQLVFGNAITLDNGVFLRRPEINAETHPPRPMAQWAEQMLEAQDAVLRLAKLAQQQTDDYHINQADPKRTEFPINSYVLVKYRDRPPTKLHMRWRGPMRVVRFRGNTYTVQNLITSKLADYHITQLKAFKFDPMEVDPADIARREEQEFLVEAILEHRNLVESKRRTDYEFRVRWAGYGPEDDSWLQWGAIRDNVLMGPYLFRHDALRGFLSPTERQRYRLEAAAH